ncbi:DNA/RNA non-specific endonuclease [Draconibacterium mangrovi]|uniref:DNA/RNA non-specific endonuclease n=1 Tax=Draconibacterium mangrovi TaxID=2697469 RepID=UPI0013D0DB47|nr:DNA/RNA non-specific endonuclease [Draconibacterium mangrovi]
MKSHQSLILTYLFVGFFCFVFNNTDAQNNSELILSSPNIKKLEGNINRFDELPLDSIPNIEIPKIENSDKNIILYRFAYTLSYNLEYKQANWVAYELTSSELVRSFKRNNAFRPDDELAGKVALNIDYKGSGWDRGHLAPAGDMCWSWNSMHESFLYSNISPQDPSFNRGIWVRLEDLVRRWSESNQKLLVVTGPILQPNLSKLGFNNISIPKYFYKIVLDHVPPNYDAIGFVIPNEGSDKELYEFAVSIDSIERLTNLDFFPLIPDIIEDSIESKIDINKWQWEFRLNQCEYIEPNGYRCTRSRAPNEKFCYYHLGELKRKVENLQLVTPSKTKN